MKTARRHELQTNTLADWTGKALEDARPYGKIIAGTLLAILVAVVAYVVIAQRVQRGQERSWNAYFHAAGSDNPADLEAVVEAYPRDSAGRWAALMLADRQLAEGLSLLLTDQSTANQSLRDALDNYGRAAEEPDDMIRQRAHLGLAKSHESLRELDEARAEYQKLLDQWPDGIFASIAKGRLADLESKPTRDFYDWLARQRPIVSPGPGEPGVRPPFDLDSFVHPPIDGADGASDDEPSPGIGDIILPQVGEPEEVEPEPNETDTDNETGAGNDGAGAAPDDGAGDETGAPDESGAPTDESAADEASAEESGGESPPPTSEEDADAASP